MIITWTPLQEVVQVNRQSLTAVRHGDEILVPHVRLFRDAVSPVFLLMDDYARPLRAQLVDVFLETENIACMD